MKDETFGRAAYQAYSEASGGVSLVSGERLPDWGGLPNQIRDAWCAAADAVRRIYPPAPAG